MSSPNILLTRIDNRLVHGQVGVTWTSDPTHVIWTQA